MEGKNLLIKSTSPYTSFSYNQTSCDVTNTRRGTTRSLHSKAGLHLAPFGASFCFVGGETPSESTVTGTADLDKRVGVPYLDKLCPSVNLAALIRGVRRRRRALSLLRCITSFGAGGALCCVPSTEVCHVDLVWTHHCVEEPSFDNIERSATLSSSSQPTIDRLNRRKAYRRQAFVPFFSTSAARVVTSWKLVGSIPSAKQATKEIPAALEPADQAGLGVKKRSAFVTCV